MVDTPFNNILTFFESTAAGFTGVAWKLAGIICLLAVVWSSVQVAFGTMDMRKAYVGGLMKIVIFFLVMSLYPAFTAGLRGFAISLGMDCSPEAQSDLVEMLKEEKNRCMKTVVYTTKVNQYMSQYDGLKNFTEDVPLIRTLTEWGTELGKDRLAKSANVPQGDVKPVINQVQSIEKVLKRSDGGDLTDSYFLDLTMKDPTGKSTGLWSPDAMLNVTLLIGNILKEAEWSHDVAVQTEYDGKKSWSDLSEYEQSTLEMRTKIKNADLSIMNLPFLAILRYLLCVIAVLLMILTQLGCLIQYIMAIAEYSITTSFSIVLIPMSLMDELKEYSSKVMGTIFAQSVKLCMITMCMVMNLEVYSKLLQQTMLDTSQFGLIQFANVCLTGLLTLALCVNAPKLAATICTGSPQMSMGEFMGAAGAIAAGAHIAGRAASVGSTQARQATRFGMNRVQDARQAVSAGRQAYQMAAAKPGVSSLGALGSGLSAGFSKGMQLTGQSAKSAIKDALNPHGGRIAQGTAFYRDPAKTTASSAVGGNTVLPGGGGGISAPSPQPGSLPSGPAPMQISSSVIMQESLPPPRTAMQIGQPATRLALPYKPQRI